jgi:hypothetical protein
MTADMTPVPETNGAHKADEPKSPLLNGGLYDAAKAFALVWLPALGTLYFTLAQIWGLPAAEEVTGTILAVDTFLGVVLKISSTQHDSIQAVKAEQKVAGFISATGGANELSGHPDLALTLTKDPKEVLQHDEVTLKIKPQG